MPAAPQPRIETAESSSANENNSIVDEEYLRHCKDTFGDSHLHTLITTFRLARAKVKQKDFEAAEALYLDALLGYENLQDQGKEVAATVYHDLAILLAMREKYDAALESHAQAMEGLSSIAGRETPRIYELYNTLGLILGLQSKKNDAVEAFQKAAQGFEAALGFHNDTTLHATENLAKCLKLTAFITRSSEVYKRVNAAREYHSDPLFATFMVQNFANASYCNCQPDVAGRWIASAYNAVKFATEGPEYTLLLDCYNTLGMVYADYKHWDEAKDCFTTCLEGKRRLLGPDHPSTIQTMHHFGNMYKLKGDREIGQEIHKQRDIGRRKLGLETGAGHFVKVRLLDQFNESIQDSFVYLASYDLLPDPDVPGHRGREAAKAVAKPPSLTDAQGNPRDPAMWEREPEEIPDPNPPSMRKLTPDELKRIQVYTNFGKNTFGEPSELQFMLVNEMWF